LVCFCGLLRLEIFEKIAQEKNVRFEHKKEKHVFLET
jgi:hypothetical protein